MKTLQAPFRSFLLRLSPVFLLLFANAELYAQTLSFAAGVDVGNSGASGTAVGDLNNDGRAEFVDAVSTGSQRLRIYQWNTASKTFDEFEILTDFTGRKDRFGGDLEIADLNNDGWKDVIVPDSDNSGNSGAMTWFENPDGDLGGTWIERPIDTWSGSGTGNRTTHMSDVISGDINADGWTDIVVRDISHGFWVFIRKDDGSGWENRKFVEARPREGLTLFDPDKDGDLDVLINGVWFETPADPVNGTYIERAIINAEDWYPSAQLYANSENPVVRDYACQVEVGDFNNDGLEDFVITNSEELANSGVTNVKPKGIRVYLAPADPINTAWEEVILETSHFSWHSAEIGDLDGDGDLDLISGTSPVGRDDNAPNVVVAFLNDGDGSSFTPQTIATKRMYQASIGDVDGDGDPDLWAPFTFNSGDVLFYENTTAAVATTVPVAPTGLGAEANGDSQIELSWTDNSDNESSFRILRNSGGGFEAVGTVVADVTVFSDSGLEASTIYTYRVVATNTAGDSPPTNEASATTQDPPPPDTQAPSAPANPAATAVSGSRIDLTWDAATDDTGVSGYRIYLSGSVFAETEEPSFSATGLDASTEYSFTIRAFDAAGNESVDSPRRWPPHWQAPI